MILPPLCDYCKRQSSLVKGDVLYPTRPDLHRKYFYRCVPCRAWVGCHPGTWEPLGRLANAELRSWKMRAHAAFDPLWQTKMQNGGGKKKARGAGYQWLAEQLGILPADCHIGMMDVETAKRVVEICEPYSSKLKRKAA